MNKQFGTDLTNKTCDICGEAHNLTRHHIIPVRILKVLYTNASIKSRTATFPIAVLCNSCHVEVENSYRGNNINHDMIAMASYLSQNLNKEAKKSELIPMIDIFSFQMNIYNYIYKTAKKHIIKKNNTNAQRTVHASH